MWFQVHEMSQLLLLPFIVGYIVYYQQLQQKGSHAIFMDLKFSVGHMASTNQPHYDASSCQTKIALSHFLGAYFGSSDEILSLVTKWKQYQLNHINYPHKR